MQAPARREAFALPASPLAVRIAGAADQWSVAPGQWRLQGVAPPQLACGHRQLSRPLRPLASTTACLQLAAHGTVRNGASGCKGNSWASTRPAAGAREGGRLLGRTLLNKQEHAVTCHLRLHFCMSWGPYVYESWAVRVLHVVLGQGCWGLRRGQRLRVG